MSQTQTVVHVLRHGEVFNPDRILYGRIDGFRLSPLGLQMADSAATALESHDITHVVSSPLERAQQTAEPLAKLHGLEIDTDPRLIEPSNYFEGKRVSVGDGALKDPRNWWALRNPFLPSWGEPYLSIAARMTAALLDAREKAEGHEAVCVSHQLPIWILRSFTSGKRLWHDPRRRQCSLASLTSFHFEGVHVVDITYQEPAAALVALAGDPAKSKGA
ncbi:histidine phosphatase family protein [Stackebrandtia soli]|uniref:histidine phosphatase family protein n=1 Tax=Stackebrandtia soli TaxID=1892856 RepID=UPI0039EA0C13